MSLLGLRRSHALFACTIHLSLAALLLPAAAAAECTTPPSPLLERAAERLLPKGEPGLLADAAIQTFVTQLCTEAVRPWLARTCGVDSGGSAALRRALVRDVATLPRSLSPKARDPQLVIFIAVIETALSGFDVSALGARIADPKLRSQLSACLAPPDTGVLDARMAAGRLLILLGERSEKARLRAARALLKKLGVVPPADLEARLRSLAKQARTLHRQAKAPKARQLGRLTLRLARIAFEALAITTGHKVEVPKAFSTFVNATLEGRLSAALRAALVILPPVQLPPGLDQAIAVALEYLRAKDEAARRRVLALLLDLPPWTEPILLELQGGVGFVDLENQNVSANADVALGYNADAWGVIGRGSFFVYELTEAGEFSKDTQRIYGEVEGWLSFGEGTLRLDTRLLLGSGLYDTQLAAKDDEQPFADETSILGRGSALIGLRAQGSRYAIGLWAGGGAQLEAFNNFIVNPDSEQVARSIDRTEVTGSADARLRLRYAAWPQVLVLRARVDLDFFTLSTTRSEQFSGETSSAEVSQLELTARAFLDLDALRFFGFVPGLGGGLNYIRISGDVEDTITIPVLTAGVRQEVF